MRLRDSNRQLSTDISISWRERDKRQRFSVEGGLAVCLDQEHSGKLLSLHSASVVAIEYVSCSLILIALMVQLMLQEEGHHCLVQTPPLCALFADLLPDASLSNCYYE